MMQNYYEASKNPVDVLRNELNKLRQKCRWNRNASFCWRIFVNATVVASGDLRGRNTSLLQFMSDEVGACLAETFVDVCRSCRTVGGTDDGDVQTIVTGETCQLVEVKCLRRFGQVGSVQVEEEIHGSTDALLALWIIALVVSRTMQAITESFVCRHCII